MPDIDLNYDPCLHFRPGQFRVPSVDYPTASETESTVRERIKPIVAKHMECMKPDGGMARYTSGQIKFLSFAPFPDSGDTALVTMRIYAFDWPHLMYDIDERLYEIAREVRELLGLRGDSVDVSFVKLQYPSDTQRSCWVRV